MIRIKKGVARLLEIFRFYLLGSEFARRLFVTIINLFNYPLNDFSKIVDKYKNIMPWDINDPYYLRTHYNSYSGYGNLYGYLECLKNYSHYTNRIKNVYIQHGLMEVDYELIKSEVIRQGNYINKIILMSEVQSEMLTNLKYSHNISVLSVGPYILYANPLIEPKVKSEFKQELNKTLTVFLPHQHIFDDSFVTVRDVLFSNETINNRLSGYFNEFDTIIIIDFYYKFAEWKKRYFTNNGYLYGIIGNPFDPNYLSRLRDLIELSDHCISFTAGTQIGFSLSLGVSHEIINLFEHQPKGFYENSYLGMPIKKPHTINSENVPYSIRINDLISRFKLPEVNLDFQSQITKKFMNTFFLSGRKITPDQIVLVEHYFGKLNKVSKDKLKDFLAK